MSIDQAQITADWLERATKATRLLNEIAALLRCDPDSVVEATIRLLERIAELEREIAKLKVECLRRGIAL